MPSLDAKGPELLTDQKHPCSPRVKEEETVLPPEASQTAATIFTLPIGEEGVEKVDAVELEILNTKEVLTLRHAMVLVTKLSIPISLSCIAQTSLVTSGVVVAGTFGTSPLGAASLAYSFISATAFSISSGFCGALDTFLTHTLGKDPNSKMYGVHTQRVIICMMILSFPCAALFAYFDTIMRLLGQDEVVTYYAVMFTRCALVGLVPFMMVEVAKRYYQSQHLTTPVLVATSLGTIVVNPVVVWVLLKGWGLGFESIPLGWSVSMMFVFVCLVGYMLVTGKYSSHWEGFMDRRAVSNWGPMLHLGGLSVGMFLGEWVMFELNNIAAGLTSPAELAAFAITGQFVLFGWNAMAGFYNSMPVFVGVCLGSKQPEKAKIFARAGLVWSLCIALVQASVFVVFGPLIARMFSDDPDVLNRLPVIFIAASCFLIVDGLQSCCLGILRGAGLQGRGAMFVAISYPVVGVPLGWIMCFYLDWGVHTLWLGPAMGNGLCGLPLCLHTILTLDWEHLTIHEEDESTDAEV